MPPAKPKEPSLPECPIKPPASYSLAGTAGVNRQRCEEARPGSAGLRSLCFPLTTHGKKRLGSAARDQGAAD